MSVLYESKRNEISMKNINEYGVPKNGCWELLPWIDYDNRPPFRISLENIAPFFIIAHHPYSISLLLRIGDKYKAEVFEKIGLTGGSADWERLAKKLIVQYEEENSGIDLFKFDSDEDIFCVYSEYVDDLIKFARLYLIEACGDEKTMTDLLK